MRDPLVRLGLMMALAGCLIYILAGILETSHPLIANTFAGFAAVLFGCLVVAVLGLLVWNLLITQML